MEGCGEIIDNWFCSGWFLTIIDVLISNFVVGPCVVGFWRGAWEYMYHFPEQFPLWWSLYISTGLHFTFSLIRESLVERFKNGGTMYVIVSRCYIYVFGVCCAMQWRSTWHLLEEFIGYDTRVVLMFTVPSLILLLVFRIFGNTLAPPYVIATDFKPDEVFDFPTMFSIPGSRDTWLYILDCFFSVFIIGTLVVFVWRGVWCLLDIYLFPDREDLSAWGSLAMGYILVFSTFATQPLVKSLVIRVSGFWRLLTVDIYLIFSFCGTVNVWRGVWNLLNLYFLPDRKVMSYWVTHVACFLLLVFINSSNSILVRGVYIDAEEDGAQCVDFPCYYLRLFFQARRRKKLLRQLKKRQIANLVGKKSETDVFPVPVVQDGIEKTPIQVVDPSQAV
ncbi:transmembrane protein fuseless isoform X4 [Lycorma delicatula]|uniref:transmembrane protein fuseless isoform X4 n=1 Tax=Lycorma delicatula TaxID=130591 RepID=UPI003F519AA7